MRRLLLFLPLTLCGPFVQSLSAQSVPVVANVSLTMTIYASGQNPVAHVSTGNFYRRSDGSVLEQWTSVDGLTSNAIGFLSIAGSTVGYTLKYAAHVAIPGPPNSSVGMPSASSASSKKLLQSQVAGIACTLYPVKPRVGGSIGAATGTVCFSAKYNLVLSRDLTYTLPDGRTRHEIYAVLSARPNLEPTPALFDLAGQSFVIQNQ
jgi:hypothetical protein